MNKDNEVDEKVPVYVVTAPERIYLQIADDAYYAEDPFPAEEEVTWCADSIMELEVSYVREDLHAATVAELRAEVESERKLRQRVEGLCSQWITRHDFALESLNELTADRNAQRDRADAAERRVGELEATLSRKDGIIRGLVSSPARNDHRSQGGHSGDQGDEPSTYGRFGSGE